MPISKPNHIFSSRTSLTETENITINILKIATLWYFVKFYNRSCA